MNLSGDVSYDQSLMIESFLIGRSVESFTIKNVKFGVSNRSAFRRIILACSNVKRLEVCGSTVSQCATIAALLGKSTSILSEITLTGKMGDAQISTIAAGLTGNTTLKKMHFSKYQGGMSPMAEVLCDISSIKGIIESNHTLEEILPMRNWHPRVRNCLNLNHWNTNENEIARKKIAKYYFVRDFNVSPFYDMSVSVIPEVLSLLPKVFRRIDLRKNELTNCQSAIFRMLKSIPELCNVSSRDALHVVGYGNKRQKIDG
eukprot:scaffold64050_cov37-Cyclotella_meneghiniana.AAC.9